VTDFRAFLGATSELVLPYFGGTRVDAPDRRLRVTTQNAPRWYRFRVEGRRAVPLEPAPPGDLSDRPAVRGHWAEGWLFASGRDVFRVALPPDDEPAPLARCTGRRWYSGDVLFDTLDFEDDAELAARDALARGRSIAEVRGAAPSLRAAFGFAVAAAMGRERDVPVSPREVAGRALEIAEGGRDAARAVVDHLVEERARYLAALAEARRLRQVLDASGTATHRPRANDPATRVDDALDNAGARMLACRRMADGMLDVRFELEGETFSCIVDANTLQVYDAGICLQGADRELTLDSLPSAIREAIAVDILHITRH